MMRKRQTPLTDQQQQQKGLPICWVPVALDGGWGWMVVLGSFLVHVFTDGIVYSFGVMIAELLDAFHEGRAKTSWIISLLIGLTLVAGPIASAVTNRFGCRTTAITGSLLATFGCLLSSMATSVNFLLLSVGLIMGVGFGLMYCPSIVIVTMYFEERRAFATGIAVCGAGIGTFVFSPLTAWLIQMYTWRGAFLIYAGILLNCAVCSSLYRPLEFQPIYAPSSSKKNSLQLSTLDSIDSERSSIFDEFTERPIIRVTVTNDDDNRLALSNDNNNGALRAAVSHGQVDDLPILESSILQRASSMQHHAGFPSRPRIRTTVSESCGYLRIKDVFYPGSVTRLPEFVADSDRSGSRHDDLCDDTRDVDHSWVSAWTVLRQMIDMSLLADPVFLLFAVSNFLSSIGFNTPLIFLPDRAEMQLGASYNDSSFLLAIFGMTNTLGRVCVGFICDRQWPCSFTANLSTNRLWLYSVMLILCGLSTMMSFLFTDFVSLVIYSAVFGFTLSPYVCLNSVLLVDFLGLGRLTNAFGLLLLFQGIAAIIGPPIAGKLVDITGNYDCSFLFAGFGLTISGLVLFLLPSLQRKMEGKRLVEK